MEKIRSGSAVVTGRVARICSNLKMFGYIEARHVLIAAIAVIGILSFFLTRLFHSCCHLGLLVNIHEVAVA